MTGKPSAASLNAIHADVIPVAERKGLLARRVKVVVCLLRSPSSDIKRHYHVLVNVAPGKCPPDLVMVGGSVRVRFEKRGPIPFLPVPKRVILLEVAIDSVSKLPKRFVACKLSE